MVQQDFSQIVESITQHTEAQGKDDWLVRVYRFFLKADGNAIAARADFLSFLGGRVPQHVLSFARKCVEREQYERAGK